MEQCCGTCKFHRADDNGEGVCTNDLKQGAKGKLEDLVFEVVTEVRVKSQEYLNSIEAWWIQKFIHEYGRENVMNVTVPKITIEDLEKEYEMIIEGQQNLEAIGGE